METVSVDTYGGIFKFVKSKEAKPYFLRARVLLSQNAFDDAVRSFTEAKSHCEDQEDADVIDLVLSEIERYQKHQLQKSLRPAERIDWKAITTRKEERHDENFDFLPQGIFTVNIKLPGVSLVVLGRKTLSDLWIKNQIPEMFCSQICADMLLGVLSDWRVTESKAIIFFYPFDPSEKLYVFEMIVSSSSGNSVDVAFPFPLLKTLTRKEFCSPPDGWDVDVAFDHTLSNGEETIRAVTVNLLRDLGLTSHVLYDPACSTGVFLHSLKQAFPECTTVGQDLSPKMCHVAKSRVDKVHVGNAMQPKIDSGCAHAVFVRFLNSEVVTSAEAELLLEALLPTVAVGGVMVVFGHTPVLLSAPYFRSLQRFELLKTFAFSKDTGSIFQYYVILRLP